MGARGICAGQRVMKCSHPMVGAGGSANWMEKRLAQTDRAKVQVRRHITGLKCLWIPLPTLRWEIRETAWQC